MNSGGKKVNSLLASETASSVLDLQENNKRKKKAIPNHDENRNILFSSALLCATLGDSAIFTT